MSLHGKKRRNQAHEELRAENLDRHRSTQLPRMTPTTPAISVLSIAFLLVAAALSFWLYRVQMQQTELQDRVADQVADVLERMDLAGVDGGASFEDVGLSLKALNDRLEELWKLAGENHQQQIAGQQKSLGEQRKEQQELSKQVNELAAEMGILSNLLSDQKNQLSSGLASRIKEAGLTTTQLKEQQEWAETRLDDAEELLQNLGDSANSIEAYRRTTNQAIIRLQSRLTQLEYRLAELTGERGASSSAGEALAE